MHSIDPKTRKEIAAEYGWTAITLRRKLKMYELALPSGSLPAAYQKLIYEKLSYPPGVRKSDYAEIDLP